MKTYEFVAAIERIPPSLEDVYSFCYQKGYEDDQVEMTVREFFLSLKENSGYREYSDPVVELVQNYEEGFLVGWLSLGPHAVYQNDSIICGYFEANPLSVNRRSGEVEIISLDNPDEVLYYCASDSCRFLEALVVAQEIFKKMTFEGISRSNQSLNEQYVERCADLAGGERYAGFYNELIN